MDHEYSRQTDARLFSDLLIGMWRYHCSCGNRHHFTFSKNGAFTQTITYGKSRFLRFSTSLLSSNELKGFWEVDNCKFSDVIKIIHINSHIETSSQPSNKTSSRNPPKSLGQLFDKLFDASWSAYHDPEEQIGIVRVLDNNNIDIVIGTKHKGTLQRI